MSHGAKIEEAFNRCNRLMASRAPRFSQIESSGGVITTRRKVAAGRAGAAGAECGRQWRYQSSAAHHAHPWMDEQKQPACRHCGTDRERPVIHDAARIKAGLQPVRLHPIPARLRLVEARRSPRLIPADGLHGRRTDPCKPAYRDSSGSVATRPKIKNGTPATGRFSLKTSRHGTNDARKFLEIGHFVPPRDETPCFSGSKRPATGHLYRYAICRQFF